MSELPGSGLFTCIIHALTALDGNLFNAVLLSLILPPHHPPTGL